MELSGAAYSRNKDDQFWQFKAQVNQKLGKIKFDSNYFLKVISYLLSCFWTTVKNQTGSRFFSSFWLKADLMLENLAIWVTAH